MANFVLLDYLFIELQLKLFIYQFFQTCVTDKFCKVVIQDHGKTYNFEPFYLI